MKIEIVQNDNGVDVVTIDGQAVSGAVAEIVLDAAYDIEHRQDVEANCGWLGARESDGYYPGEDGPTELWGPEDGGHCPCGGTSCDGTCGANVPF